MKYRCFICCARYMPDLLSIKVVGRLSKVRRNKLYYLLKNEGPEHVYQTEVRVPK